MIESIRNFIVTWKVACTILGLVLVLGVSALLIKPDYNGEKDSIVKSASKKAVNVAEVASAEMPSAESKSENQLQLNSVSQKKDISIYVAPKESVYVAEVEAEAEENFIYLAEIPLSESLQRVIYNRCEEEKLDYHLVLGLIWRESRFDVNAVGYNTNGTVDTGLMQINDVNRKFLRDTYGIDNLLDPEQNILAGTSLLGGWAEKHGQHYAIMAYRSGEYGMLRKMAGGITTDWSVEIVYEKGEEFLTLIEDAKADKK